MEPQKAEPIQSIWFGERVHCYTLAISVRIDLQLQRRIDFIYGVSIKIISE